jgi:membrane protein implicated in regulation of membrane protease activity
MNDILHANIFFFITSVAVVVLAILGAVALYYILGILKNIRNISDRAERGSEILAGDMEHLRENIKEEGMRFRHIKKFIKGYAKWFPSEKDRK